MKSKIAIATCAEFPKLYPDDHAIVEGLREAGVTAEPAVWNGDVAWGDYAAVVLRSTWDYYLDAPAFVRWLDHLDRIAVPCWNPTSLVRWNMDKRYLKEIAAKGVLTVPTLWIEQNHGITASEAARRVFDTGWSDLVVKPAVSAGAWKTNRFSRDDVTAQTTYFGDVLAGGSLMVQPFMPEIVNEGEYSLLFFDGKYSHAVLKRPQAGDFRVQWMYGGRQGPVTPSASIIEQARTALEAAPSGGLYGRVDGVVRDSRLIVMELELIEPYLSLSDSPGAADRYVRALRARL